MSELPPAPHPLGDRRLVNGVARAPFSEAGMEAADNLLRKAARSLAGGDDARADRLIARAVALPYDEREEMFPAAISAAMMLFTIVGDEVEVAEDGDLRWLTAALQVLPAEAGWARSELRATLRAVRENYALSRQASRLIEPLLAEAADRPEIQAADLTPTELAGAVRAVLDLVVAYVEQMESLPRG